LLTDENIDPDVVMFLRRSHFDVLDLKEAGLQASTDIAIIRLAHLGGRVVVTEDYDFCQIVFVQAPDFVGVVHFKPGSFFSGYHVETMKTLIETNPDVELPFFISAERKNNKVRIRVRNALPGASGT
jgi:hypothetical protein